MRFRLRTLLIAVSLLPALIAREPLAIVTSATFIACVLAAITVEAADAMAHRTS